MKTPILLSAIAAAALPVFAAEQKPSGPPISTTPPPLSSEWTKKQLTPHFWAEGACAADVNKDGKMDVLSGPFWYEGPDFAKRHTIYQAEQSFTRKKDVGTDEKVPGFEGFLSGKNAYSNNFISYAHDVNSDGWPDYVVIGFPNKETFWWENPQGKDELWQRHTILAVTDNESPMFVDIDGDKVPDLLCMSNGTLGYAKMDPKNPGADWKWNNISGEPTKAFHKFTHGIGYGDINGDGRTDIIEGTGWWEQPANWDGKTPWNKHDALFGMGSQQYGYDVNGDGKTDVISALAAHQWGLAWFEQTNDGGAIGWTKHLITGTPGPEGKPPVTGETGVIFSQPHAIDLVDMNGDGLKDIVTGKRTWAHGPAGDPEPNAPHVVWWFELKREGGKAKFIPHLIDSDSGVGTQVMAIDLNGDGKPDVVVGNKKGVFVHTRN
jgi:hypothetical protein